MTGDVHPAAASSAPASLREATLPYPRLADRVTRQAHRLMLVTIGGTLGAALLWADATELNKVTRGNGKVIPQLQNQTVQHFEGGIVTEILVREGDRVEISQPLLRVANSFSRAELQQARLDVKAKRARLARLDAETRGDGAVQWPAEAVADVPTIVERETDVFASRVRTLDAQLRIIRDQTRQKELELAELKARWSLTKTEREFVLQRVTSLRRLAAIGAVSQNELLDNERGLAQIDGKLSDLLHDIPRTEAALQELSARLSETTLRFRAEAERERSDTALQIAKLEESITAMADRSLRSDVLAPISGIVNKLFVTTVGGVVKSGEPLVQVVPADSAIAVEAKLSPADRAQVWPGLPAVVKISAYDYSIHGGLEGRVVDISPDALQDERGTPYFRVRLEAQAADFGPDKPVVPGMVADVDILSGKQTVMQALLRPLRHLRDSALRQ
jgi:HlyD family type I secretion membrane fusion protein